MRLYLITTCLTRSLLQNVNIPSWYTNNYFSFKIPSNGHGHAKFYRTGFSVQSQTLTSGLNIVQNNGSINPFPDSASNQLDWIRKKLYTEAAYDLPGTVLKANLTLPLTLQQISYGNNGLTRLSFNPQLAVKYQVSIENYLSLNYSYRDQTGNIENIYPSYVLTNYRTLYANNAPLNEQQNQQAAAGFSYRKALTLFFWSIGTVYNRTHANTIASSLISNSLQKGIVLPYPNSTDTWALSGTVSKYAFALRTTFSGGIAWQNNSSVQLQNNSLLPFSTRSETVNVGTDTKVSNAVNLTYKATWMETASHSAVAASAFHIDQLQQKASVNYDPLDALQLQLSGEHYFTRQQGNPDLKYFFADASVKYRVVNWKVDFQVSAVNFSNVKTYNALYLSANTLTASSYTLPGRILLFKVLFNL